MLAPYFCFKKESAMKNSVRSWIIVGGVGLLAIMMSGCASKPFVDVVRTQDFIYFINPLNIVNQEIRD